eukprot:scaffold35797_cov18-Tisochrysis_lutea.AAC.1
MQSHFRPAQQVLCWAPSPHDLGLLTAALATSGPMGGAGGHGSVRAGAGATRAGASNAVVWVGAVYVG